MLRYAFFADFKGGPKLLVWGDQNGMTALSRFLREMATAPREVEFSALGFCAAAGDRVIALPHAGSCTALRKTPGDQRIFHWEIDKSDAERFAELVDVLAASAHGHQYLEPDRPTAGAVAVMVSIGEYPDDLIESKVRPD
jgi:hypothetical protein